MSRVWMRVLHHILTRMVTTSRETQESADGFSAEGDACVWGRCQAVASHRDPALLARNASSTTVCFAVSDIHSTGKNKMG